MRCFFFYWYNIPSRWKVCKVNCSWCKTGPPGHSFPFCFLQRCFQVEHGDFFLKFQYNNVHSKHYLVNVCNNCRYYSCVFRQGRLYKNKVIHIQILQSATLLLLQVGVPLRVLWGYLEATVTGASANTVAVEESGCV